MTITGLFISGAHWKLFWKKVGGNVTTSKAIKTGRTGTTKMLGNGRWLITVKIVQPNGVPVQPERVPGRRLLRLDPGNGLVAVAPRGVTRQRHGE